MVCPSPTRAARTSTRPPAPWGQARASGDDVHHPNSDILEQRYTEKLLVMVNKSQLEDMLVVLSSDRHGTLWRTAQVLCLVIGSETGSVHYYISGLNIMFSASYEEIL